MPNEELFSFIMARTSYIQCKEYKIGIGCFSTNLTASGQLLHLASNINIQLSGLV
jgi:hypothetical protein